MLCGRYNRFNNLLILYESLNAIFAPSAYANYDHGGSADDTAKQTNTHMLIMTMVFLLTTLWGNHAMRASCCRAIA